MSVENELGSYKYWVAPFIIENFRNKNKELDDKLNELDGDPTIGAIVIDYIVKEERMASSDGLLDLILKEDK